MHCLGVFLTFLGLGIGFYISALFFFRISVSSAEIQTLPLMQRRRLLGYIIPVINVPLFLYNLNQTYIHIIEGIIIERQIFWEDFFVLISTLFLSIFIPRFFPVYQSKYYLNIDGLEIRRFLRKTVHLGFKTIDRVEIYIRMDNELSKKATKYATDQAALLRKSGFKFKDFTNAEDITMNIFTEKSIYMISPAKPRTLLKELKRRNKRLTARIVELTQRGKKVQDLA
jgi:hypothetical protein